MTPLFIIAGLATGAVLAKKAWDKLTPHHAQTTRTLKKGESYVLTVKLTGTGANAGKPTIQDATEVLEHFGLHPFSVVADTKEPSVFAVTTGFTGKIGDAPEVTSAVLPGLASFTSATGKAWNVALVGDPVHYDSAAKTPLARKATGAPPAPSATSAMKETVKGTVKETITTATGWWKKLRSHAS